MLEEIEIINYQEKNKLLGNFQPENSLWVTSDIKSRTSILNSIQQNHSIIKYKLRIKSC